MDRLPVKQASLLILALLAATLFIVWWPFAMIWCVNTLFGTQIPMTFKTWIATVVLFSMLRICVARNKD